MTFGQPMISDMILRLSEKTIERHKGKIGQFYTFEEISHHNQRNDFWTIINGKVYDLTDYLMMHPGGYNLLFKQGGRDGTHDFEGMFHSRNAKAILEKFYIGKVLPSQTHVLPHPSHNNDNNSLSPFKVPTSIHPKSHIKSSIMNTTSSTASTSSTTTTNTNNNNKNIDIEMSTSSSSIPTPSITTTTASSIELLKAKIISKTKQTPDTYYYQLEIDDKYKDLNWISPLTHVSLSSVDGYQDIGFKSYTPIKQNNNILEFLIKGYENGTISKHIHNSQPGDYLMLKGPIQTSQSYTHNSLSSSISINNDKPISFLLLIAGGTGITPMLQVLYDKLIHNERKTQIVLIYSNKTKDDIIWRDQLDQLKQTFGSLLLINYVITVNQSPIVEPMMDMTTSIDSSNRLSRFHYGRINEDMILSCLESIIAQGILFTQSDALVCGPVEFNRYISDQLFSIGYSKNKIHLLE